MTAVQRAVNAEIARQLRAHVRAGKDVRAFRFVCPDNVCAAPASQAKATAIDASLMRRIARLRDDITALAAKVEGPKGEPTVPELVDERSRLGAERPLVVEEARRFREKASKPSLLERASGVRSAGQSESAKWAKEMAVRRDQRAAEIDRRLAEIDDRLQAKAAKLRVPDRALSATERAQLQALQRRLKAAELASGRLKAAIEASSNTLVRRERQARRALIDAEIDAYRKKIEALTGGEAA